MPHLNSFLNTILSTTEQDILTATEQNETSYVLICALNFFPHQFTFSDYFAFCLCDLKHSYLVYMFLHNETAIGPF